MSAPDDARFERTLSFPEGFLWGAATAAYQIEGAISEDGRAPSIWDAFCRSPGTIEGGDSGDVACDHYHRCREDIALMQELGLQTYRLSLAWPRIVPEGDGEINPEGLAFYRRLLEWLHEAGISPMVTLYHWDLPLKLQEQGGWGSRDTVDAFVRYARTCYEELGDLVPRWATINEPWCVAMKGNLIGDHAPGVKDLSTALTVAHNVLLAHARAVAAFRDTGLAGDIGIVLNLTPATPASGRKQDVAAARRFDGFFNRWFLDPLLTGAYPTDMVEWYRRQDALPLVSTCEVETLAEPIDYLGVNYYYRQVIRAARDGPLQLTEIPQEGEHTTMGWGVTPEGIHDILVRLARDYHPIPIYITENGAAFPDQIGTDGRIRDPRRQAFLRDHLSQVHRAIEDGVDVRGYYAWSLMDNFEWERGYSQRFGIVYVDYPTQRRIPKDSARWYARVIEENGLPAEG